jgi:nucleotide-binding universal stress UspA family protein
MNFVVATDGSSQSDRAVEYATEIADGVGASLTAVFAVDPNIREDRPSDPVTSLSDAERRLVVENIEDTEERGRELLEAAVSTAESEGVPCETEMLYGDPADAISTFADQEDVDGIFVGHRGISAEREGFLGSVAKGLVDRATVPVTVVR